MTQRVCRLATAQYDIAFHSDWGAYATKIESWFARAAAQGAQLLVFPEYFSLELASLFGADVYGSLSRQLDSLQELLPAFIVLFAELSIRHAMTVVAGTFPVRAGRVFHNRSFLFRPDGTHDFQDKLVMTRFERERWFIDGGDEIRVFSTAFGIIGINICYDSEFPSIARRQVEAGADLIVVPSCTDTRAGYHRVRIGAQARALENQCYVVHASTVGDAGWSEAVDINVGAAAVYTPVDYGYPDDGVLICGTLNEPGWVVADIDLASIARVRDTGQVFNYRDWPRQFRIDGPVRRSV